MGLWRLHWRPACQLATINSEGVGPGRVGPQGPQCIEYKCAFI